MCWCSVGGIRNGRLVVVTQSLLFDTTEDCIVICCQWHRNNTFGKWYLVQVFSTSISIVLEGPEKPTSRGQNPRWPAIQELSTATLLHCKDQMGTGGFKATEVGGKHHQGPDPRTFVLRAPNSKVKKCGIFFFFFFPSHFKIFEHKFFCS